MKLWKKILFFVFTLTLFLGVSAGKAQAAEKEAYTYRITFYSGIIGDFKDTESGLTISNPDAVVTLSADRDVLTISGLNLGDVVAFHAPSNVEMAEDSRHYVQGVRLSGYDNDTVAASAFSVERDRDYVVAYGIAGNMTSYTVRYQDANGNTLAPDETYYGNVGDKPVVPYLYVDGWVPRYIALTKTLSSNEAENILTFIYDKFVGPTASGGGTHYTYEEIIINGGTVNMGLAGGTAGGAGTGGTGAGAAGAGTEGAGDGENLPGADGSGENTEVNENPGILDLDDEDVPLADLDLEETGSQDVVLAVAAIVLGVVALGLLTAVAILLLKKQKQKKDEE